MPQEPLRQLEPSGPNFNDACGSVTKCMKARGTFDPWEAETVESRIKNIPAENIWIKRSPTWPAEYGVVRGNVR